MKATTPFAGKEINNMTDLSANLVAVFQGVRDGTIESRRVVELNNAAGKIISAHKVLLANFALRGEVPKIPFLCDGVVIEPPKTKPMLPAPAAK